MKCPLFTVARWPLNSESNCRCRMSHNYIGELCSVRARIRCSLTEISAPLPLNPLLVVIYHGRAIRMRIPRSLDPYQITVIARNVTRGLNVLLLGKSNNLSHASGIEHSTTMNHFGEDVWIRVRELVLGFFIFASLSDERPIGRPFDIGDLEREQ